MPFTGSFVSSHPAVFRLVFHPSNVIHRQVDPLVQPTEQLPVEVCKQTPLLLMYKVFTLVCVQAPPLELDATVCMHTCMGSLSDLQVLASNWGPRVLGLF